MVMKQKSSKMRQLRSFVAAVADMANDGENEEEKNSGSEQQEKDDVIEISSKEHNDFVDDSESESVVSKRSELSEVTPSDER